MTRAQIEALKLQQSGRLDKLDLQSKDLINAIRNGQDIFAASLHAQTLSLKDTVEEAEVRIRDDHTAARDEVIAAVDDTDQRNQIEHQATREELLRSNWLCNN